MVQGKGIAGSALYRPIVSIPATIELLLVPLPSARLAPPVSLPSCQTLLKRGCTSTRRVDVTVSRCLSAARCL